MCVDFIRHLCINKTNISSHLLVVEFGFYFEGTFPVIVLLLHSEAWVHEERSETCRMWRFAPRNFTPTHFSFNLYHDVTRCLCICRTRPSDSWLEPTMIREALNALQQSFKRINTRINISISRGGNTARARGSPLCYVPVRWACPPPLRTRWVACSPRAPSLRSARK